MSKKVLVITGPTASGKSKLAIEIAKKINGVVISADSMQIYRGLDIGTAKVTVEEAQGIKHELIDICNISEHFDVAQYKETCYRKIEEIFNAGKLPIICGGTGLYINAVINNIIFSKANLDSTIKEQLEFLKENMTTEQLYEYLCKIDSESAAIIDNKNARRILRAIELKLLGSSKIQNDKNNNLWNTNNKKYEFLVVYIDMPRDLLYDRIDKRVDKMVCDGILNEVKKVYAFRNSLNNTACQAIGYKEFFEYLDGLDTLDNCIERLKINTRHYAKRQITWFKKIENKLTVDGRRPKRELLEIILKEYYEN